MDTKNLLNEFYSAFRARDAAGMARCYHPEVEFSDPVFTNLKGHEVGAMWHMLISRGKETKISFKNIQADDKTGSCEWEAVYPYGPKRRLVHNVVSSKFEFRDGKIIRQRDSFDLWKWLGMALGPAGSLLGWTGFLKAKVRNFAAQGLRDFMKANPQAR